MSVPPHYVVYRRRFGLFRRFWWFAMGAGAAALWIRHHERETPSTERRRFCSYLWRRDLPPAQQPQTQAQTQTPPPYAYDWAAHRPGLQASVPDAPAIPHASESQAAPATPPAAPLAPATPAIPTSFPAPPPTAEEERRRRERDREELEHRAREYAADKLERLSAALDRLREGLMADGPRSPPAQEKETRWV